MALQQLVIYCDSFQIALSIFFQEATVPTHAPPTPFGQQVMTPCNTPATPPNFPDTLMAFSRMSANTPVSDSIPMCSTHGHCGPQARQETPPATQCSPTNTPASR
ncbi:UBA-like domain-containing protein 2 [Ctenocephalides felis]|uniref:UBA-like domain-containing protein 2 n=1 Tax=Ctenocephalides felis TaxID=7515 RepID=UPI000E6E2A18|nr:UBA-like domain-containing protein 2 [Ctenocephalides felis]